MLTIRPNIVRSHEGTVTTSVLTSDRKGSFKGSASTRMENGMINSVRCGMIIRKPFSICFPPTPWLQSIESERDTLRVDEYKFQASCECSLHCTMQVLLSNGCCCVCLTCRNRPVGGSAALETCTKETFLLLLFFHGEELL